MTCATCHDAHGNREFLMRTEKRGRQFCFMSRGAARHPRGFEAACAHQKPAGAQGIRGGPLRGFH
jgi:hypothetical protein